MDKATDELSDRVGAATGLNRRASTVIAGSLMEKHECDACHGAGVERFGGGAERCSLCKGRRTSVDLSKTDILREAKELGYEPKAIVDEPKPLGNDVSLDEAVVLDGVYENSPRVLCEHMPKLGKAPDELRRVAPELAEQLPEEIRAMLVKIDVFEGKATFWLRDEANDVDRPIGPIDLTRYSDERALLEAFTELVKRLDRVLAADFN